MWKIGEDVSELGILKSGIVIVNNNIKKILFFFNNYYKKNRFMQRLL